MSTDKKKKKKKIEFSVGQNSPIGGGGLHLTFDAHFRTRVSYSSQKSCVKIWLGLVEIGGMQNFRGGDRIPLLGGSHVNCDAQFLTWPSYFSEESCLKIWFGFVESFKSYRGNRQKKKKMGGG